jgi:PAS domain S-box-containing protein
LGIGALVARSEAAIVAVEAETHAIVLWTRAAEALFGYTAREALGLTIEALVPPALRDELWEEVAQRAAPEPAWNLDAGVPFAFAMLESSGGEFPVELSLTRLEPMGDRRVVLAVIRVPSGRRQAGDWTRTA